MILRPYQNAGLADVLCEFAAGTRAVLYRLPTGGGKTTVFTRASEVWPGPVIIVAHRRELIRQASARLRPPHGIIAPGFPRTSHRVQVASIQTLAARRYRDTSTGGLIVPDEAHHSVSGTWRAFLDAHPAHHVLGVTATPIRLDGRGLGDIYQSLVVGPNESELIADGYLAPFKMYTAQHAVDLSNARRVAGDFSAADLAAAMDKKRITGDAANDYAKHCPGAPAIAFCTSVAHARHVADEFRGRGWRSTAVDGAMRHDLRDAAIGGLGTGAVQVLCAADLISEGVDIPAATAAILLRPTDSLTVYRQQCGRVFRPVYAPGRSLDTAAGRRAAIAAGGKPTAFVLDHAGNWLRHGLPDAEREWKLDSGRRAPGAAAPAVRQCPECFAAHAPAPKCPACGHEYSAATAAFRKLTATEGELVDVTGVAPPPLADLLKAATTYADVEAVRISKGYKPGWTHAIMAHRGQRRGRHTTAREDFGL